MLWYLWNILLCIIGSLYSDKWHTHSHNTPQFKEGRDVIAFPPSSWWGWSTSFLCLFSLLSLGRMPSCIKKDTESGSSICLPRWVRRWQAGLIVSAALHYKRDYRWQLRLLIKAGTLKKTEEPCSRHTSVSSHQAPTHPPLPNHHLFQQLPLFLVFLVPHARVSELSRVGSDITRICQQSRGSSCQRQPVLCQASPRQAVIQPSSPHIKTPHWGGEGRRERKN